MEPAKNRDLHYRGIWMENNIFEQIMEICSEKKVVSRCKKLSKKSKLTSGAVAGTLTELGYWLYVYGHIAEAIKVCEFSHIEEPKPGKVNYNIWDFVLWLWGLEAYIYHKQNAEERCNEIIVAMERVWSIPSGIFDTTEKISAHNRSIRNSLTYEDAINKNKIEEQLESNSKLGAAEYRFTALFHMIGYGVTGLYPHLEEHKAELEELIEQYIQFLK